MDNGIYTIIFTVLIFTLIGISYTRGKKFSIEEYIVARKSMSLIGVIATLVATGMGAWILFSPAETTFGGI